MVEMKELITTIVEALVDHPDQVVVRQVEDGEALRFTLSVHKEDMGKVIGKQGRIAKAIRTVVFAAAGNQRIQLDIID